VANIHHSGLFMQRIFNVLCGVILLILHITEVSACDFCNLYSGVTPMDRRNRIELNFRYSIFSSPHWIPSPTNKPNPQKTFHGGESPDQGSTGQWVNGKEIYLQSELRNSVFLSKRYSIILSIPWMYWEENVKGRIEHGQGQGDITCLGQYAWIQKIRPQSPIQVWSGVGIKIPTGMYYSNPETYRSSFFKQSGTGTWDYLFNLAMSHRPTNSAGYQIQILYRKNTRNPDQYRAGDVTNFSSLAFITLMNKSTNLKFVPAAGLALENAGGNRWKGFQQSNTGGLVSAAIFQNDCFINNVAFRQNVWIPIFQQMHGRQPRLTLRFMFSFWFIFGKEKK